MKIKIIIALIVLGNSFLIQSAARDPQAEQYETLCCLIDFNRDNRDQILAQIPFVEINDFLQYEARRSINLIAKQVARAREARLETARNTLVAQRGEFVGANPPQGAVAGVPALVRPIKMLKDRVRSDFQCPACLLALKSERPDCEVLQCDVEILPCGHEYCSACLTRLQSRICPECRAAFSR